MSVWVKKREERKRESNNIYTHTHTHSLVCPECCSVRLYRAGLRYLSSGKTVQRWLCRDCSLRFSEPKIKFNIVGEVAEGFHSAQDNYEVRVASEDFSVEKTINRCSFSGGKDVTSHETSTVEKDLNCLPFYNRSVQVCAQKDAKNLKTALENKPIGGEKGQLVGYAWKLKKRGLKEKTIEVRMFLLNQLLKLGTDLDNTDSVETILATENFTVAKKHRLVAAYRSYCQAFKIQWAPVKTHYAPKQPFVPLESELDALISAAGKTTATFLQVAKDTGARGGEIAKLRWTDIDTEKNTIAINNPEKGSNSRTLKVSAKTIAMLNALNKKYEPYIFNPNPASHRSVLISLRRKVANRLQNPRLKRIHLHSFRHWKATVEFAKTKDVLWVAHVLGHKNIKNTQIYMHLADFRSEEEYHSAVARAIDEARKLVESGFHFVCDIDGAKLFSKRK